MVVILAGVVGCGKQLTREKAAEMIIKEYGFPIPITESLSLYRPKEVQAFESSGLVKATKGGATLTDKGRKYFVNEDSTFGIVRFKVCEQVFLEVTGMKKDKTSAQIEYTWKYDNFTEVSKVNESSYKSQNWFPDYIRFKGPQKGRTVYFSLYDDGWRIEK